MPNTNATVSVRPSDSPNAPNGPRNNAATDGSANMPINKLVSVTPSCAPDSWNVNRRTALSAVAAPRSPATEARSTSLFSTVVNENSAATNTAHAATNTSATINNTSSVKSPPAELKPARSPNHDWLRRPIGMGPQERATLRDPVIKRRHQPRNATGSHHGERTVLDGRSPPAAPQPAATHINLPGTVASHA